VFIRRAAATTVPGSKDNEHVIVSDPERTLLEALAISPDLPAIQARAQIVLRAAEGLEDEAIAAELSMKRKDVLHWRKRFEAQRIRGLWDPPGPGPKKRVSPEKERALIREVLHDPMGMHWGARLLAQKHGLNRAAVYRIFAKYGIVRGKRGMVNIARLKIFSDPLFGVTVSGIEGLYYARSGVLALTVTRRPLSQLSLTDNATALQATGGFMAELRKLAELHKLDLMIVAAQAAELENYFLCWLKAIEARRESNSEVHLLADWPTLGPQGAAGVQQWLVEHPDFQMDYAPIADDLPWIDFVQRSFAIITTLPVQAQLIEDINQVTSYLAGIPDQNWLARAFITKQRGEEESL
jgi:transposase